MPTTVTGSAGGYAPTSTFSTTTAAALEAPAASQIITPVQDLADALEYLRTKGPHTYAAVTTWTLCGTFDDTTGAGNAQRRIYMGVSGLLAIVDNATWAEGVAQWTQEEAALRSGRLILGVGSYAFQRQAAGAAPWADGAWVTEMDLTGATGDLTVALGNIAASAGSLSAATTVTGGTGVTATTGNVTASAGEIVASAGKLQAQGDPAADEARVECKQFVSTTAAIPTIAKGAAMNNGDVDGAVDVVAGSTDIKGRITVVTGAAVDTSTAAIVCTVTFNKAYPTAPEVVVWPTNAATAELARQPYVEKSTTTFVLRIPASGDLTAAGASYGWCYHVLG